MKETFRLAANRMNLQVSLPALDRAQVTNQNFSVTHVGHSQVHQAMSKSSKTLKTLHCALDVEGHVGTDGRYYVLDTARTFPPEASKEAKEYGKHPRMLTSGNNVTVRFTVTDAKKYRTYCKKQYPKDALPLELQGASESHSRAFDPRSGRKEKGMVSH